MADGTISIKIEVDGKEVDVASKELDQLGSSGQRSGKDLKSAEDGVRGVGRESDKASMSIKKIATSLGLVAVGVAAFKALKAGLDDAITRFDTLNNFPKVLQSIGVSAEDSERAMNTLADGIDGLPTKLDDIASTAQRMYTSFDDMDEATDSALALNNALLGSGASADQAKRGTEQYLKALQTGKMDMDVWNTLSETMDVGLVKVAESFGFAGKSAKDDLYKALQDGTITMDDFNDKLIEVGTGTGIMAKLAKENTKGIRTSLGNLQYAFARGITGVLNSLDKLSRAVTGNSIAENIDNMKHVVTAAFGVIEKVIEASIPIFKGLAVVVKTTIKVVDELAPVLIGVATAFAFHAVVTKTQKALKEFELSVKLAEIATLAKEKAVNALGKAMTFLRSPLGLTTLAIGAVVTAAIGIPKWFNRSTEAGEKLKDELHELRDETEDLTSTIDDNIKAYQDSAGEIESNISKNEILAEKVMDLAEKENKSASEKMELQQYTEQLNDAVDGLNLAYDEEADALNMSSDLMQERLDLFHEEIKLEAARERMLEIETERMDVEMRLKEAIKLREEYNEKFNEGEISQKEYRAGVHQTTETINELTETSKGLAEQQEETESIWKAGIEAMTESTADGVADQIESFEDLDESQKEVFGSMEESYNELVDHATDAFDRMSNESKVSAEEMISNLEHNQKMTEQWGENVAALYERAGQEGNEGFIQWLESMGPDSAAELQVVSDMSDSELDRFIELMNEGGTIASDSLKDSLGEGLEGAVDVMTGFVDDSQSTLREEIKNADFPGTGMEIPEGLREGIIEGAKNVESATETMAEDTKDAFAASMGIQSPSTVFKGYGHDMIDGLVLGLNDGYGKVKTAVDKLFEVIKLESQRSMDELANTHKKATTSIEQSLNKLNNITKTSMQNMLTMMRTDAQAQVSLLEQSSNQMNNIRQQAAMKTLMIMQADAKAQSNLFRQSQNMLNNIARQSMQSMATTLRTGSNMQLNVMRSLAQSLPTPFSGLTSRMRSIGVYAMSGLNAGLRAGSGSVMFTARNIANRVAATMRSALKIHSPSRVMRDDIGKMIPAGLALGMQSNAGVIDKAIHGITDKLTNMRIGTPEMALGVQGGGAMRASAIVNNYSNYSNTSIEGGKQKEQKQIIIIKPSDVHLEGRPIGEVTWEVVEEHIERNKEIKNSFRR